MKIGSMHARISLIFHGLYSAENQLIEENAIYTQIGILNEHFGQNAFIPGHPSDPNGVFEKAVCENTGIPFCLVDDGFLGENEASAAPINYIETNVNSWGINK